MGIGKSKVTDKVLEEKMRRREAALLEDDEEEEKGVELRRNNSLVLALEDYLEGRADNVAPLSEKELANRRDTDDVNPRELVLDKLATTVAQGNYRTLREEVIQHLATINRHFEGKFWQKDTLLHVAAREGYCRMVEYETDPKSHSVYEITEVEIDPLNNKKRTPLMLAFSPPQRTYCGRRYGVVDGKAVSEKPDGLESFVDWDKPGGHEERHRCVVALVKNKADVNRLDFLNYSTLHYACMLGWRDTVEFLLSQGAKTDVLNVLGQNALQLAVKYDHDEVVELLLEEVAWEINHRDSKGDTALLYAIRNGHTRIVELLLDFGADPNMEDYKKNTPMKLACRANHLGIVNLLLDFNVPRDKQLLDGLTGEAKEAIDKRLDEEAQALAKKEEKKRALQDAARRKVTDGKSSGRDAKGAWVPYQDKRGRGVFYYNKWEVPSDYVKDRTYVMKPATFGMSFYHT